MAAKKTLRQFFVSAGLVGIFFLAGSCAIFGPAKVPKDGARLKEPGAAEGAPAAVSAAWTEEQLLAEVPLRVRDFLLELRQRLLTGDLDWILTRTDPAHRERYIRRRGMDNVSYLSQLMDLGGSFSREQTSLAPEPASFDLESVTAMRYMDIQRQDFSWLAQGLISDRRGRSIDFSLDVLGELETILLAGW